MSPDGSGGVVGAQEEIDYPLYPFGTLLLHHPSSTESSSIRLILICSLVLFYTVTLFLASMNSVSNGREPSRQPRKYGRSATTSVAQLISDSDVVRSCTNLLHRLTTKNLINSRASEFDGGGSGGGSDNNNTPYISAKPTTTTASMSKPSSSSRGPDSPMFDRRGQLNSRKNSGTSSISSNPSDSYAYVKYKPPLPTGHTSSNLNHHSSNLNNNLDNDNPSSRRGSGSGAGSGISKSTSTNNFSYFGNDRLKELEQKLSERYQRLFGSDASSSPSSTSSAVRSSALTSSNKNLAEESSGSKDSQHRSSLRSHNKNDRLPYSERDHGSDDFRGYGLSKSASTSGGGVGGGSGITSRLPYSSTNGYSYGLGGHDPSSGIGSSSRLPLLPLSSSSSLLGSGSNLGSSSSGIGRAGGLADLYPSRRTYGLAKSASSSVIQDSGLGGLGLGGSGSGILGAPSSSKYYHHPLVGGFSSSSTSGGRPYTGSNSHLLEPVPEIKPNSPSSTTGYGHYDHHRERERNLRESSGLSRSNTLNNLDKAAVLDEDFGDRATVVRNEGGKHDEENGTGSRSSQRKSSYKLPSRYYYRRYRHKSSHTQPKEKEPSPLSFNNAKHVPPAQADVDEDDDLDTIVDDSVGRGSEDDDNNNKSTRGDKGKGTEASQPHDLDRSSSSAAPGFSHLNGVIPSSHVLAYDITPRNKGLKDGEDLCNGVATPGNGAVSGGTSRELKGLCGEENGWRGGESEERDVDLVRKKEIEDLIKKYSGFTYTSSKYVQLKDPNDNVGSQVQPLSPTTPTSGSATSSLLNGGPFTAPLVPSSSSTSITTSHHNLHPHNSHHPTRRLVDESLCKEEYPGVSASLYKPSSNYSSSALPAAVSTAGSSIYDKIGSRPTVAGYSSVLDEPKSSYLQNKGYRAGCHQDVTNSVILVSLIGVKIDSCVVCLVCSCDLIKF